MASKNPPKTDLVAICKLEFYRKQKNWKFCGQDRKVKDSKRRSKPSNLKLNQTYNIAPAPKKDEPPEPETPATPETELNLNEAFVETETGTASESDEPMVEEQNVLKNCDTEKEITSLDPPGSPYSPRWSIQRWAERRRLWDPEPTTSTPDPTCPPYPSPTHNPCLEQNIESCPVFDNNYNTIQQDIYSNQIQNYPHFDINLQPKNSEFDTKYGSSVYYYNSNICSHVDNGVHMMRSEGNILMPHGISAYGGKEWDDYDWCAGEGAAWSEAEWLAEAAAVGAGVGLGPGGEDALDGGWRNDLSSVSRCDSLQSVASTEFIRGAALAPHSTQIDLLLGPEPAAALPGAALAAAVARHSAALRELLHEAHRRQQVPPKDANIYNFDEIPVRDPGPTLYHPPLHFNDPIIACSRATPDLKGRTEQGGSGQSEVGRGRGRLKVGIRMGRPYRISEM